MRHPDKTRRASTHKVFKVVARGILWIWFCRKISLEQECDRMFILTLPIFGSMIEDGINGRTIVLRRLHSEIRGQHLRLVFVQLVIVFVVVGDLGSSTCRGSSFSPKERLSHGITELGRTLLLVVRATFAFASLGIGIRERRIIVIFVGGCSLGDWTRYISNRAVVTQRP